MSRQFRLAIAQTNPTVGAVEANADAILEAWAQADGAGADLCVTGEMALTGYVLEDLAHKPAFIAAVHEQIERITRATSAGRCALAFGTLFHDPDFKPDDVYEWSLKAWPAWQRLFNSVVVVEGGKLIARRDKHRLPDNSVFDDSRVYQNGPLKGPVTIAGLRIGLPICEDIWWEDTTETQIEAGAEFLISANASPWERGKLDLRQQICIKRAATHQVPVVYSHLVGGQDELVFDGGSFAIDSDCSLAVQMPQFETGLSISDWQQTDGSWRCVAPQISAPLDEMAELYQTLLLGVRDYLSKNGFSKVVLGLSGGIDSAITAVIAADALGAENVHCVMMPSPYTSQDSLEDAAALAQNIAVRLDEINIGPAMAAFDTMLAPLFDGLAPDLTEENIQSRIRGGTLMAISNKLGALVLTTGNKSEIAVGYATLYGDMCGAYNAIGDLYKTEVFELCRWINRPDNGFGGDRIPDRIITKPPSAELRPDQKDSDSLPDYPVLDGILHGLIEREASVSDLVAEGHDRAVVQRVWRLLDIAEYKRKQAAPAVRVSSRGFGKDRRYPITNRFRG